jgi:AcrR family transcriptional regulator
LLYSEDHVDLVRSIAELKREGRSLADIKLVLNDRVARARDNLADLAAQESERVHVAIIHAATEEFVAKGYGQTHVATIIRQLGINPQLFYSHFPSKLDLLVECFKTYIGNTVAAVEPEVEAYSDPAERAMRRLAADHWVHDLGAMLAAAIRSEGRSDELEDFRLAGALDAMMGRIAMDIGSVRAPGSPAPAVPDELLAYAMLGAHRFQRMRASWGGGYGPADFLRSHLLVYLALLAAVSGEVDIYSRLAQYEDLIQELSARMPDLPPTFDN